MLAKEWIYRWEGHEVRVHLLRGSQDWDRLYLDGNLATERRGWHFFPVSLAAQLGAAGQEKHQVYVRVGWGLRCRIWIDSVLACYAVSHRWFLVRSAGHLIEARYREWGIRRRVRLSIDNEVAAERVGKGAPSKLGFVVEGQFKRSDGSPAQVTVRAGSVNGTILQVDSASVFRCL